MAVPPAKLIDLTSIFDKLDLKGNISSVTNTTTNMIDGLKKQVLEPVSAITQNLNKGVALISNADSMVRGAVSTFTSQTMNGINSVVGGLSGGKLNLSGFGDLVNLKDGIPNFNVDQVLGKVTKQFGFDVTNIKGFSDSFGSNILSEFNKQAMNGLSVVTDSLGNVIKTGEGLLNGAGDMGLGLLKGLDGDWGKIHDSAITNSFLNTVTDVVAKSGISSAYKTVCDAYDNVEDGKRALINAAGTCVKNGDLDSMNAIMKIVGTNTKKNLSVKGLNSYSQVGDTPDTTIPIEDLGVDGVGAIAALYPTLIEDMLSNFEFKASDTLNDYATIQNDMLSLFASVGGDNWHQVYVPGYGVVDDLSLTKNISPDGLTLLADVTYLTGMLTTSNMFNELPALTTFKNNFPKTPILH